MVNIGVIQPSQDPSKTRWNRISLRQTGMRAGVAAARSFRRGGKEEGASGQTEDHHLIVQ